MNARESSSSKYIYIHFAPEYGTWLGVSMSLSIIEERYSEAETAICPGTLSTTIAKMRMYVCALASIFLIWV
jgi:hypothetical protein